MVAGKLILTNSVGITVWTTRTAALSSSDDTNLQLQLLNTGNLVLHSSKSVVIWESFDIPTDTLLPQQTLTMVSSLISKRSQDDYSSGNYKLFLTMIMCSAYFSKVQQCLVLNVSYWLELISPNTLPHRITTISWWIESSLA